MKSHDNLECLYTGEKICDNGLILSNLSSEKDALLRAIYLNKKLTVHNDFPGIYKYADWLPIHKILPSASAPVTYKSTKLAKKLGLTNLYITFSGYWPEKECNMTTGTFKECEAFSVCSRIPDNNNNILVVASAGNTARAFAKVCSENNIKLLLVVPEKNLNALWFDKELNSCVKLIAVGGDSDYFDAIELAEIISKVDGFMPEGGARNVARRDGMGTTVLSAVTTIGEIPDYYFQAIGSGTGAIAAWEANLRFIESGMYGNKKMSLQLSQNIPFIPIYESWKQGSRDFIHTEELEAKQQVDEIKAKVLSNRKPPYSIIGGLYDALIDTKGDIHIVSNDELEKAGSLFEKTEGIDISPAASVAVASLINSVNTNKINKESIIMLNITGGGMRCFKQSKKQYLFDPNEIIMKKDFYHKMEVYNGYI